jgi:ABC-2 type transport system permease protein
VSVTIKELRELLRRPLLVLTLILGPLIIMIVFGVGTNNVVEPPTAIVVVPDGAERPRLVREYQREFDRFLRVVEYTDDEEGARARLARSEVNTVVILPETPYQTIAAGRQARIRVLYNEIDPARRQLVPDFVRVMAGDINREIFLQNAGEQQQALGDAGRDLDLALRALEEAEAAADRGDRPLARRGVQAAQAAVARLDDTLALLGPGAGPLATDAAQVRLRLQEADRRLAGAARTLATPDPRPLGEQLGLAQTRRNLQHLNEALEQLTSVPPEVAIAPLAVETRDVAQLNSDVISFFAPAMLALLVQHAAVSLGALALVRERLAGTFELYIVAPTSGLQLLLGKYLAYTLFVLTIGGVLLAVLLSPVLRVPLFGDPRRLALVLVLLTLASTGLGFALSLLATSERQAVQFSMLALLGIVFFSGIALPLDALIQPALTFSYALPATYGVGLLQDVMLRGLPGSDRFVLALALMAAGLFAACLLLLSWRTCPA